MFSFQTEKGICMSIWNKFLEFKGIELRPEDGTPASLYKKNLNIAWPATLEGALIAVIGSIDTVMVGTMGSSAIAAVGLTNQPRMILLILAQALCVGTTALVARRKGADDREAANRTLAQSMGTVTLLGLLITALGFFGAEPLMRFGGANDETIGMASTYFRIVSLSFLFNCWQLCICAAMRAIGQTRVTMVTHITANLVNVFLNYCLIGGNLGFPAMGVAGAALATAIGTVVASIIAFFFVFRKNGYLRLNLLHMFRFDRETMRGLTTVGMSSMAESVALRIGFLITTKLIAGLGTAAMASYQIVSQVTTLSFTLGDGIAAAGASYVGQSLGAERPELARAHVIISRRLSMVTSILLMLAIFIFRNQIAELFTNEANIIWGVTLSFYVVIVGIIPQNGRIVYSGCLRGAGDVRFVAVCALLSVAIIRPIATWLLCYPLRELLPMLELTVTGPWAAFVLDSFVRDAMLSARIRHGQWLTVRL